MPAENPDQAWLKAFHNKIETLQGETTAPLQSCGGRAQTAFDSWWSLEQAGWLDREPRLPAVPPEFPPEPPAPPNRAKTDASLERAPQRPGAAAPAAGLEKAIDRARTAFADSFEALRDRTRRRIEAAQEELDALRLPDEADAAAVAESRRQVSYCQQRLAKALDLADCDLHDLRHELFDFLAELSRLSENAKGGKA
ncbi:MAG: hypothetical protein PHF00_02590 [Elusimicrobia bacterium]|nr:hypothetical protein [Elusimicrobiota bacterium]